MLGRDYSILERFPAAIRYDPVSVKFLYCHLLWLLMLAMSHPRKLVSVLYKKRKFAHRQARNVSKTEVHSTRELANIPTNFRNQFVYNKEKLLCEYCPEELSQSHLMVCNRRAELRKGLDLNNLDELLVYVKRTIGV